MSYFVYTTDVDFLIPQAAEAQALQALKDLNKRHELKEGGVVGGDPSQRWFAYLPTDYDNRATSTADVFGELGFEVDVEDGSGTRLLGYNDSQGQEHLFLAAVAPFVADGAHVDWHGEDGRMWRNEVREGRMVTLTAVVTYV